MDEIDKRILELLQKNSRMSYNDISQNIVFCITKWCVKDERKYTNQ